jgi:hypothetical protein
MWWFRRRQPPPAPAPDPEGVLVRVIGCLSPGHVRVLVGPGVGQLYGGLEQDWPLAFVPEWARFPNGEFRVSGFIDEVPQVIQDRAPP